MSGAHTKLSAGHRAIWNAVQGGVTMFVNDHPEAGLGRLTKCQRDGLVKRIVGQVINVSKGSAGGSPEHPAGDQRQDGVSERAACRTGR